MVCHDSDFPGSKTNRLPGHRPGSLFQVGTCLHWAFLLIYRSLQPPLMHLLPGQKKRQLKPDLTAPGFALGLSGQLTQTSVEETSYLELIRDPNHDRYIPAGAVVICVLK